MDFPYTEFDPECATAYRKTSIVLAFRSDDAFVFHKPWGTQAIPEGGWILVPLDDGIPTGDIYGCHPEAFVRTYQPANTKNPHAFEKHAVVQAYQPGRPFAIRTLIDDYVETDPATGGTTDWLVRNQGGELYVISDVIFRASYRPA